MAEAYFLPRQGLQQLLTRLQADGYQCLGPQVRDGAIVYAPLEHAGQLPAGVRQQQAPGSYRLEHQGDARQFAWANGPQALKPLTFAPRERLWEMGRGSDGTLAFCDSPPEAGKRALLGVRACDLAALQIQERHFLNQAYPDPHFAARCEDLLLIAVNCSHPAATCFCASTGDGPVARAGYDLSLDELDDGFVLSAGSTAGEQLLAALELEPAGSAQLAEVEQQRKQAASAQTRALPSTHLREALFANLEHPRWQALGERCLACGNCTAVCPTCFCHGEQDEPALDGAHSAHYRQWDSCFSEGHSYLHGFLVRADTPLRYRQWLTHKLGSWHDQYGRSGCVGCGRCISWCPVGIDLTEEAAAICGEGGQ